MEKSQTQAAYLWLTSDRSGPSASTLSNYTTAKEALLRHLGHENAAKVTERDIVSWKDHLVAEGRSAKTINGTYLAFASVLFGYGERNKLLPGNPAKGIKAVSTKKAATRMLPYDDAEVEHGFVDVIEVVYYCVCTSDEDNVGDAIRSGGFEEA